MGKIVNTSKLDLNTQGLSDIPEYVFQCRNLQWLDLSKNNIKEIPARLSSLKRLRVLDLSNNSINHLLSKTFDLNNLEILNLNHNRLTNLPKQIGKLSKLKRLFVNGNSLEILPVEMTLLRNITHLGLSDNFLTEFPNVILELENLKSLWIGRNNFDLIPVYEIEKKLQKLSRLYTFNPQKSGKDLLSSSLFRKKNNSISSLKLLTYTDPKMKLIQSQNENKKSNTIFISYSHKDKEFKDEVEVTLKGVQNIFPGLQLEFWADDRIKAGYAWEDEIRTTLNNSAIAILIASRNFIASDFIMKTEVPSILENAQDKGVLVLTIVAGESMLQRSPIGKFQWINDPKSPIKSLPPHEQDAIYNKLAVRIAEYFGK